MSSPEGSIHLDMGITRALAEKKAVQEIKAPLLILKPVKKANLLTFTDHRIQPLGRNAESLRNLSIQQAHLF